MIYSFLVDAQKTASASTNTNMKIVMSSSSDGNLVSSAMNISFVDQQMSVIPSSTSPGPFSQSTSQIHLSAIQTTMSTNQGIGTCLFTNLKCSSINTTNAI